MAGLLGRIRFAPITVTSTNSASLAQVIAPANHRLLVWEVFVSGKSISSTDVPIQVEILKQTDAGTAGDAVTAVKWDDTYDETLQASGLETWDAEPTAGDILVNALFHPQSHFHFKANCKDEAIPVPGGDRLGVRVDTVGQNTTLYGYIKFEE